MTDEKEKDMPEKDGEKCTCGQNHDHDHSGDKPKDITHGSSCPCCNPKEPSAEDDAAIEADPASRSLSRAIATSFGLLKVVMIVLVGLFLLDSFTFIEQGKVGLMRRFGSYLRNADGTIKMFKPGRLCFQWPAPIEVIERIPVGQELELKLDTQFWPRVDKKKALADSGVLPKTDRLNPEKDGYNLTGDLNIVHSQWLVKYVISDPEKYKLSGADPEAIMREIISAVILRNVAGVSVDDALIYKSGDLFSSIDREAKAAMLDETAAPKWGITVTRIIHLRLVPPGKTKPAFDAVTQAYSEQKERIDKARAEATKLLAKSKAEANRIKNDASAYKRRIVTRAASDAQSLKALLDKFPGDNEALGIYLSQYRHDLVKNVLSSTNNYLLRPGQTWFMTGPAPDEFMGSDGKQK